MPRAPRDSRIETRTARIHLAIRNKPYWRQIERGLFIGYRRSASTSAWVMRHAMGGRYVEDRVGTPDDRLGFDGAVVLSYSQALARIREIVKGLATPAPKHHGDGPTVNDCWTVYKEQHLDGRATADLAEKAWAYHVAGTIGPKLVRTLTTSDYRAWLRGIASKPPRKRGKEMPFDAKDPQARRARNASTNRLWGGLVKPALNFAHREKFEFTATPWRDVPPLPLGEADEEPPRMLDRAEVKRLLAKSPDDLKAILTGALMTGARYGELGRMRVRDFDADTRRLTIRQSKTGKRLYQPLSAEGVKFFEAHVKGREAGEPMFKRADGSEWGKSHQHRGIKAAAKAAKLTAVSFKATRATYGKLLLLATRDIELVAKALGHSDSRITRKHYAQLLPSEVAVGIAKLPKLGVAA